MDSMVECESLPGFDHGIAAGLEIAACVIGSSASLSDALASLRTLGEQLEAALEQLARRAAHLESVSI